MPSRFCAVTMTFAPAMSSASSASFSVTMAAPSGTALADAVPTKLHDWMSPANEGPAWWETIARHFNHRTRA